MECQTAILLLHPFLFLDFVKATSIAQKQACSLYKNSQIFHSPPPFILNKNNISNRDSMFKPNTMPQSLIQPNSTLLTSFFYSGDIYFYLLILYCKHLHVTLDWMGLSFTITNMCTIQTNIYFM